MPDITFNDTVTVFNQYKDADNKTTWKKTVLKNCFFSCITANITNNLANTSSNKFICRIPVNSSFTENYNGEKDKFTLHPDDIIIKGDITDEMSDTSGCRPFDFLNKYKGNAFTIKEVSVNTKFTDAQHYRASGI